MKITTTDGCLVIKSDADKFKNLVGDDLRKAMESDVEDRNKRAIALGIKARYELADA